jgi:hypothetical protein
MVGCSPMFLYGREFLRLTFRERGRGTVTTLGDT